MKIAIIDDGINPRFIPFSNQLDSYQIINNNIVAKREESYGIITHATICALIICQLAPDVSFIDLKILDKEEKSSIYSLIKALDWCYVNSIKLVHMSLGTLNYHDILMLENMVNKLLSAETILVSAYHNKNIKSYPAALPGVFGVRNEMGKLKNGEYSINICDGLNIENCFVAHYEKLFITDQEEYLMVKNSNSFAAPVITGHIATFLEKCNDATRADVLAYLQSNASHAKSDSEIIRSYINSNNHLIQCLVIGFISYDYSLFKKMHRLFLNNEYHVESFSDIYDSNDNIIIPIEHYCANNVIDENIIYTLEYIYKPDVILLCLDKEKYEYNTNWNIVDAFIEIIDGKFTLLIKNCGFIFNSIIELFEGILKCFN